MCVIERQQTEWSGIECRLILPLAPSDKNYQIQPCAQHVGDSIESDQV